MVKVGEIYTSFKCGDFIVVSCPRQKEVTVEFLKTKFRITVESTRVKKGNIRDKLCPTLYRLGFIGDGEHKLSINGVHTKAAQVWGGMFERCYSGNHPTYKAYNVCKEWHNFQNFAKWFYKNYQDGKQIDKDIRFQGKKIYSPETCMFVTAQQNVEEACQIKFELISPDGILYKSKNVAKFCRNNNLNPSCVYDLLKGRRNSHKGWRANA